MSLNECVITVNNVENFSAVNEDLGRLRQEQIHVTELVPQVPGV
jgi:hypothetical protein